MAWTSRQIYDVTRIMIYALAGIFLICALVAAVPGARWYELYEMATIIAQLVMFAGAIVAPIAAIAGAHVYYTGQRGRKQKEHDHDSSADDRLQRIYNQLSSEDETYLRSHIAQNNLSLDEADEISAVDDVASQRGKQT